MKQYVHTWMLNALIVIALTTIPFSARQTIAQGFGGRLTVEGLHQLNNHSAAARAFGGVTIGAESELGLMFVNPTAMQSLNGPAASIGGFRRYRDMRQEQQFAPVRYYPNLSLLLEGLTDDIPDPDPDLVGFTPADSVQRPFDDIVPHWSRSKTANFPLHALLAVPISLGDVTITAGVGAVQYANLHHFHQNNNVLDPAVLSQRPLPVPRPTDDNPVTVDWYQSIRSREGSIQGYGAAFAGEIEHYNLTIGISGLLLKGSSDDFEQQVQRGELIFYANEFRADSSQGHLTMSGTSEFTGMEFTLGSVLNGRFASVGFVLKPPMKFTRTYQIEVAGDTSGTPFASTFNDEDRFQLPWRGSVGLLLKPREKLKIGLEYELRPYASATFTSSTQGETSPWESSSLFRIGTEYQISSWLVLRGGIRGEADVFIPEGSPITDEPVSYSVYSAGFGVNFYGFRWNIAYENAHMKYNEIWGSALSRNWDRRHVMVTDISFTIPI